VLALQPFGGLTGACRGGREISCDIIPECGIEDEGVCWLDEAACSFLFLTGHFGGSSSDTLEHFELAAGEGVEHSLQGLHQ
jgi:hypothetical protein